MSPSTDGTAGGSSAAAPALAAAAKPAAPYVPIGGLRACECADLLKLVSGVSRPLEDVVAEFLSHVPRERRLRFGSALCFVLEDKMMLQPAERLIAFTILHQGYCLQLANPFAPFLINAACDETSEKKEQTFFQILLSSADGDRNKEILKQSSVDYLNGDNYESQEGIILQVLLQRGQLEEQFFCGTLKSQQYSSILRGATVRSVIPAPDVSESCVVSSEVSTTKPNRDNVVACLLQQEAHKGLVPQWIRPSPPRLEILEGELQWLNLDDNHDLLWDGSMCADTSQRAMIQDLVGRACKGPLAPDQQEQIVMELAKDRKLVYHCGMTPEKLPDLVEHNPHVAVEVLSKLINFSDMDVYFDILVHMEMSLHSMEVVNNLTQVVVLPPEFVHDYISNCIRSCEGTTWKISSSRYKHSASRSHE